MLLSEAQVMMCLQEWLSEAELGQSFDKYDADQSGDISFPEFEHMVITWFCYLPV